jgi:hypothetical protein
MGIAVPKRARGEPVDVVLGTPTIMALKCLFGFRNKVDKVVPGGFHG